MKKQRKPLTTKQIKIIDAKVAGNTGRDIGKALYPNATPESASVLVSRELNKVNVQEELQKAFERHGITIDRAIKPVSDGLEATKTVIIGKDKDAMADQVPDHSVRLKASQMATQLMGLGKQDGGTTNNFIIVAQGERNDYGIS